MTGQERHFREMIKGQELKIAACQKKIMELNLELEAYLASLPKQIPPPPRTPEDTRPYCGKILYTSENAANKARKLINRDLVKYGKKPMKRAYLCEKCEAWHLTTIPSWMPFPEVEG